jgi:hypothetical protein
MICKNAGRIPYSGRRMPFIKNSLKEIFLIVSYKKITTNVFLSHG